MPIECENEECEMVKEYDEHTEEDVIDSIEANEYLFFENGEMAHITHYVDNHKRAGETEFHFKGNSILI